MEAALGFMSGSDERQALFSSVWLVIPSFCPAEDSAQPSEAAGSYEPGKGLEGPPASSDSAGISSGKPQMLAGGCLV